MVFSKIFSSLVFVLSLSSSGVSAEYSCSESNHGVCDVKVLDDSRGYCLDYRRVNADRWEEHASSSGWGSDLAWAVNMNKAWWPTAGGDRSTMACDRHYDTGSFGNRESSQKKLGGCCEPCTPGRRQCKSGLTCWSDDWNPFVGYCVVQGALRGTARRIGNVVNFLDWDK